MIKFENVSKSYKLKKDNYVKALNNVSFEVEKGDICFYLGPNGAGKSTTIKLLLGVLKQDEGIVKIDDNTLSKKYKKEYLKNIGISIGNKSQLIWDVPIIESLILISKLYRVKKSDAIDKINHLANDLNVSHVLSKPPKYVSLGERVKSDLIASMIHDPKIVYMDEPTIGVDVLSKDVIYKFIKNRQKENRTTFFITTHDISWVEKVNTNIILIDKGSLIYRGSVENLKDNYIKKETFMIEFNQVINKNIFVNHVNNFDKFNISGNKLVFSSKSQEHNLNLIDFCFKTLNVQKINELNTQKLEDIIVEISKK